MSTHREKGRHDFKSGAPCIPPVEKLTMYEYLDGWASAAKSRACVLERADVLGVAHDSALRLFNIESQ